MSDMSGFIYGHMIGNMLKDNASIEKLVADYNDLNKVCGDFRDMLVDTAKAQRDFVCDDVGLRAVIRALTKGIRFVSPFHYCPVDFIKESIGCRRGDFPRSVRRMQPVDPT